MEIYVMVKLTLSQVDTKWHQSCPAKISALLPIVVQIFLNYLSDIILEKAWHIPDVF